jgi:hypothetical protein
LPACRRLRFCLRADDYQSAAVALRAASKPVRSCSTSNPGIRTAGRAGAFAAASAPVWERRTPDAACVELLYLLRSIPRQKSGAVPDGPHIGCTGGPGHRVAGRCTVDGSNESRWWIAAPPRRHLRSSIVPLNSATVTTGDLADSFTRIFLVILPFRSFEEIDQ